MARATHGFTIVEVMLFLGISGLLLLVAMMGVNANINNTRFNDAVRTTTSFLQSQYDEVSTGRSDRSENLTCDSSSSVGTGSATNPTKAPGTTNCAILGRYILIQGSELKSRYIIGYRSSLSGIDQDDVTAINQMNPRVAPALAYDGEYGVPWSIGVTRALLPSESPASLGLAIIQSPASGNILYFTFNANGAVEPNNLASVLTSANANREVRVCFADGSGRNGGIKFESGQGQEVIQTDLSEAGRSACS